MATARLTADARANAWHILTRPNTLSACPSKNLPYAGESRNASCCSRDTKAPQERADDVSWTAPSGLVEVEGKEAGDDSDDESSQADYKVVGA